MSTTQGQALENAIIANPDDLGAHAAYADWLIEQGDPRGEFIQVQLALEDVTKSGDERRSLQKREKALLNTNWQKWLGQLAEHFPSSSDERIRFARGWIDSFSRNDMTVALSRTLAKCPQTRLLRQLIIGGTAFEDVGNYDPADDVPAGTYEPTIYPLARSEYLGNVRVFQLGDRAEESEDQPYCHINGEVAVQLIRKMPRIEELYLAAHGVDTATLFGLPTLSELRVLQVYHVHQYPLELLAANRGLRKLTHLLVHPHALEPGDDAAYINLAGVKALLYSPHLQSLSHLRLHLSDIGDDGCREIVASGILRRLTVLDLKHGCITDEGAKLLAACPDLENLATLDIGKNRLSEATVRALRATGIRVAAAEQRTGDEDDLEYLVEGDWE